MGKLIRIAPANAKAEDKAIADVLCTGKNDELVISAQIESLTKGGTIQLLDGDFYIDSFPYEDHSAIYYGYNEGQGREITIMGDTQNKSYNTHFGVALHVTKAAQDSLPEGETGHVFYGTGKKPDAPGAFYTYTFVNNVCFKNFYLFIKDASRPIIGIDCIHFGGAGFEQIGVFTERYFEDRFLHEKPATPCKGSVGIRSSQGSNDEMAFVGFDTIDVGGFYIGFEFIGADHMILRTCAACRCVYGYVFNSSEKTITMLNCCDEGNTHLPLFHGHGQLTAPDFNIERFNADFICDDPEGNTEAFATEDVPGSWSGIITYTLQGNAFGVNRLWKQGHGENFRTMAMYHKIDVRSEAPEFMETFLDREAHKVYTWLGDGWYDAAGNRAD